MTKTKKYEAPASKKTIKYKKAPDAPKRFKSAFIFFSAEKHKEFKKELQQEGKTVRVSSVDFGCWWNQQNVLHASVLHSPEKIWDWYIHSLTTNLYSQYCLLLSSDHRCCKNGERVLEEARPWREKGVGSQGGEGQGTIWAGENPIQRPMENSKQQAKAEGSYR